MFIENKKHCQQSLMNSAQWMDPKVRRKLEKSWAPIFYEHVFCRIDEKPFAVLYGKTGNPNFPVNILLALEYIKHIRDCNDLELLDAFSFDYQVNYAVGMQTLGERNLSERTLYYFRERLYRYCVENPGDEDLIFGQFKKLVKEFAEKVGILLDKQRTDTTLFMSNIKKAGRLSLAYDVLIKAIKAIPEDKRTEALTKAMEPSFKTDMLFRIKAQESDSKLCILLTLCGEALRILKSMESSKSLPAAVKKTDEIGLLERFLSEQSVIGAETGKRTPKPNKEISSGSLQSAYDGDATYRRKGNVSQSGYLLEISETCDKENPFQIITDYAVGPNNVSDQEMLIKRLEPIRENTGCTDMYVDGGFHSDEVHQAAKGNGMEIHLTNMSGTEPNKKLPVTAYEIDEKTDLIQRCPGGHAPIRAGISSGQTSAHFPHEACTHCAYREQCHSKKQVKDCVVRISLKAVNTGREREQMKESRVENTSMRAGIEGSNSALKRTGLDKLEVRGIMKSTFVCGLKTTVQNIKRFTRFMRGGYKQKPEMIPICGIPAPICG